MTQTESMVEIIEKNPNIGEDNENNINLLNANIRLNIQERNNEENNEIELSRIEFEIINKEKSIFKQVILSNEFKNYSNNNPEYNLYIILKDINGNEYKNNINLEDFNDNDNIATTQYIRISIIDRENNNFKKKIQIEGNTIGKENISYFEVILKDRENNFFNKKFALCRISYKKYLLFKIELYNIQFYENFFFLSELKAHNFVGCKNPEEFIDKFKEYFDNKRILLICNLGIDNNLKEAKRFQLKIINENPENGINNGNNIITFDKKCSYIAFYIFATIISICKFIRIILQIGEFYFSIILFGLYLETTTLLITSSSKFMSGAFLVLEFFLFISIIYFTNILSILPLTLQFWEVGNLRYIKEKNPFKVIIHSNDDTDEIHYIFEIGIDTFCLISLLLYIISLSIYNNSSKMFEILNAIFFVFLPALKFSIIFFPTWWKGVGIITSYFNCECCPFDEGKIKKIVNYDSFEKKISNKESPESFGELEPVQLFMYNKKIDCWFQFKFWSTILCILLIILVYPIYFRDAWTLLYLVGFFILSFPLSIAVPNNLFFILNLKDCFKNLCCCSKCLNLKINENIIIIGEKFKGLKYWIYIIQFLINACIIFLVFVVKNNNDYEYDSVKDRLGDIKKFNELKIEDFTEQTFSRNYVKSPMCFTTIHHLNFIQLASLAQAAYLNQEGSIKIAKDYFYSKSLFTQSNAQIENMEFLTRSNDNVVLLRTDIKLSGNRDLIVFSIRGSYSFRDWWLDLEMYCPSTLLTIMKMIPLIQKQESFTLKVLNTVLTFPLRMMEGISLIKQYSDTVFEKVDPIVNDNQDKDILFVGHSLGGGLSKYIAIHYQRQSFSVSGPGISPLEYMNQKIYGYNNYFKSNFIDIIPDNDIVPRLEVSGGIKYRVLCQKDPSSCHSIDRTLCMIGLMCEQEELTKRLCLSMPNIGEKEYKDMKIFKNGEKFCNNYVFDKDGNINICKNAKVSSSKYQCYYIHLQYLKDDVLRNEYKCLQFNEKEKENYKLEFESKYPEENRIIDIS